MRINNRWMVVLLLIAGLQFLACKRDSGTHQKVEPAHVEHIQGSDLNRVTLTEKAMKRLDVKTVPVREVMIEHSKAKKRTCGPYSAVIYDPFGQPWAYTSPEPRTFVRHRLDVDFIDGDLAILNDGPTVGTEIATVGAAELYGAEFGMGH